MACKRLHSSNKSLLTETFIAVFLLVCSVFFFSVNVHNILEGQRFRRVEKAYAEVERPAGFVMNLAAIGTMVYFLEVLSYLLLVFTGLTFAVYDFPFLFQLPPMFAMRVTGLVFTSAGYCLFVWSVIVRGRYAVSWEMPTSQRSYHFWSLPLRSTSIISRLLPHVSRSSLFVAQHVYGIPTYRDPRILLRHPQRGEASDSAFR